MNHPHQKSKWTVGLIVLLLTNTLLSGCQTTTTGFIPVSRHGQLYYEERGKGEALILLHGHSLDTRMWDEQFQVFARHYRTIRFDFRGYGKSSAQKEGVQFTHVDDLISLMDSLHIDKAHVIGLSMGAFVSGDMLALHPERMLSCVLASGGIRNSPGPSEPMDSAEQARRDREIEEVRVKGIESFKRDWLDQLMASGGSRKERMRDLLWQMISDWTAWQPLHKEARLFYGKEAWGTLRERGRTDVPTLIVRGENEMKDKKGQPAEMSFLSNVRFIVLPDCGHMLNMEQPKRFNNEVINFIKNVARR